MNRTELVAATAEKCGMTKKDTDAIIGSMLDVIADAMKGGDKVQLVGFGTFEVRQRAARMGRNPKTKEEIKIPAAKVPAFKPGKALKDSIG